MIPERRDDLCLRQICLSGKKEMNSESWKERRDDEQLRPYPLSVLVFKLQFSLLEIFSHENHLKQNNNKKKERKKEDRPYPLSVFMSVNFFVAY